MRRERIEERPARKRRREDPADLEILQAPPPRVSDRSRRLARDLDALLAQIDRALETREEV
jgi:hypothetical protein